jgi:hypothetical protein
MDSIPCIGNETGYDTVIMVNPNPREELATPGSSKRLSAKIKAQWKLRFKNKGV